ncbi:MAG: hypothetical protein QM433_04985 [Euryarchaeota archaeon]|nr:hypothetical protein [Euryarchaeota archaeon]
MAEVEDPGYQAWIEEQMQREYEEYQRRLVRVKPVVEGTSASASAPVAGVISVFKKWLHVAEDYVIVGPLCAAIANFCPGESDIIGIVGPSGSSKTEFIRSLGTKENDLVYPVSTITDKTLVSGYPESDDLAPRLKGRLLTIKDLTSILSSRDTVRSGIFADFREMADGYIHKEYGSGVIKDYQGLSSSVLFASTNAIEQYNSLYSSLGQRLIFIRPRGDPKKARERAKANRGSESAMRRDISNAVMGFIRQKKAEVEERGLPEEPGWFDEEMGELYDLLAIARTTLRTDIHGNINEIPEPEFPTRIAKTVSRLCAVHAMVWGRDELNEDDFNFGLRIILDNIPTKRSHVLMVVRDNWLTTAEIASLARLPTASTKKILEELHALGIVDKLLAGKTDSDYLNKKSDAYRLTPGYRIAVDSLKSLWVG